MEEMRGEERMNPNEQLEAARARVEKEVNLEKWHDRWQKIGAKIITAADWSGEQSYGKKVFGGGFDELTNMANQAVELVADMDPMDDSEEAQQKRAEYKKTIANIKSQIEKADSILSGDTYAAAQVNSERLARAIAETEAEKEKLQQLAKYNDGYDKQLEELERDLAADKERKEACDEYLRTHEKPVERKEEPKERQEEKLAETPAEEPVVVPEEEPIIAPEEQPVAEVAEEPAVEEPVVEAPEELVVNPEEAAASEEPAAEAEVVPEAPRAPLMPEAGRPKEKEATPEAEAEHKGPSRKEIMMAFRKSGRERLKNDTKEVLKNGKSRKILALAALTVIPLLGGCKVGAPVRNDNIIVAGEDAFVSEVSSETGAIEDILVADSAVEEKEAEENKYDYETVAEGCEFLSVGTIKEIEDAAKAFDQEKIKNYDANVDPTIWHGDENAYHNMYNVSQYRIEGSTASEVNANFADKYVANNLEMAVTEAITLNLFGLGGETINGVTDIAKEIESKGLSDQFRALVAEETRKLDTEKMTLTQIPRGAMFYSEQRDHDDDDSIEESVRIVDGSRDEAVIDRTDALTPEQKKLILDAYHVDEKDDEYDVMFVTRLGCGQSGVVLIKKTESAKPVVNEYAYEDRTEDVTPEPELETPETPEVPEAPETPEIPETPEVPEAPETPEIPETPEVPETPETPETPEVVIAPKTPERIEESFRPMEEGGVAEGGQEQLTVNEEKEPEGGEGRTFEEIREEGIGITEAPVEEDFHVAPPEEEPQVTSDDDLEAMLNEFLEDNNLGQ